MSLPAADEYAKACPQQLHAGRQGAGAVERGLHGGCQRRLQLAHDGKEGRQVSGPLLLGDVQRVVGQPLEPLDCSSEGCLRATHEVLGPPGLVQGTLQHGPAQHLYVRDALAELRIIAAAEGWWPCVHGAELQLRQRHAAQVAAALHKDVQVREDAGRVQGRPG